ncbi:thermonuclease family protein [Cyanobium sp. ATX 6F1]|uniref:thermonuclease family protein n=1 Tax=unclassified Cyanobium TaxID=2627006 RepID=UPI003965694F|nr:thermonuclease family protein [Cyanobium sp. ATX 6F1]
MVSPSPIESTVAEVISGVNINLALVEDGMAFANRKYLGQCNAKEYLEAEDRASRSRYGVWQVPGGITRPWDFRRGRTAGRSARTTESIPGGWRVRASRRNTIGWPEVVAPPASRSSVLTPASSARPRNAT